MFVFYFDLLIFVLRAFTFPIKYMKLNDKELIKGPRKTAVEKTEWLIGGRRPLVEGY